MANFLKIINIYPIYADDGFCNCDDSSCIAWKNDCHFVWKSDDESGPELIPPW